MNYTDIAAGIKTILDTVTELNIVYNHEPKELTEYPAATISAKSHENDFNDLCANIRKYTFIIRLYYRTDQIQDAETILRDVADKVIAALEADPSLGGVCDFATPTRTDGDWINTNTREVPVKVVPIVLEARKRELRV